GSYGTFTATVVEITTDDGISGVGECIARRAPRVVETVVRDLLWPVVEGKDPRDVSGLHDAMFAALRPWGHYRGFVQEGMSGIDQALWDIVAQSQGVPLYKALHGASRATVPVYGSKVYTTDIPAMAKEARGAVDRGHKAIKVQIGRSAASGGPSADVAVIKAIREEIGPDIEMGVDVNSPLRRRHRDPPVPQGREIRSVVHRRAGVSRRHRRVRAHPPLAADPCGGGRVRVRPL